ncbi:accessory gene regulator B family protein, partial [Clostridium neonatale]
MSITEKLAFKLGNMVKTNLNTDSDETDIIIYGAINLFQTINSILWVIIVGFFTGALYETLLFSITASILRKYSGGVHA